MKGLGFGVFHCFRIAVSLGDLSPALESWNGLGWKGPLDHLVPPCPTKGRDVSL